MAVICVLIVNMTAGFPRRFSVYPRPAVALDRTTRRGYSIPVRVSGSPQGSSLTAIRRGTSEILGAIDNLREIKILSVHFSGPSASAASNHGRASNQRQNT